MKRKICFFFLFLVMMLTLVACKEPLVEPVKLAEPQNIVVDKRVISWDPVENASGYLVRFQREEYQVEDCHFNIRFMTEAGQYDVSIIALGDGKQYEDSVIVSTKFTLGEIVEHGYDEYGYEYTFLEDRLGYEVSRGKANLKGDIVIPDYFGDYPVKRIAKEAFSNITYENDCFTEKDCNTVTTGIKLPAYLESIGSYAMAYMVRLKEIVIPDSVIEIGGLAFEGCKEMTRVVLPKRLKVIENFCFRNTALSEVTLPDTLECIEQEAFACEYWENSTGIHHINSALKNIALPDSLKSVGTAAFYGRENLEAITYSGELEMMEINPFSKTAWYESQPDGPVYWNNILCGYKGEMPENTVIEITPGTKGIADRAFSNQDNLVKVIMPDGINFIGSFVFSNSTSLSEVVLPTDLERIPRSMFSGTKSLKNIVFPESVRYIGENAFSRSGLERIVIPGYIKEIETKAFSGCESLKEIVLEAGVEILGRGVFAFITAAKPPALEILVLPATLKQIGSGLFGNNTPQKHLYYAGTRADLIAAIEAGDSEDRFKEVSIKMFDESPIYYYSETAPTEYGNYWHYVDGKPTPWE